MSPPVVRCRFCRSSDGQVVLDLGHQPSCELFPSGGDPSADELYPLRMWLCADCGLAQLADDAVVPEEPVGHEPAAVTAQRAEAVARVAAAGVLPASGTAMEFPSPHGGTWLDLLAGHGLTPSRLGEPADVVVDACHGLMHEPDQRAALEQRVAALRPGGVLVLMYHSLAAIMSGVQWNALRLGHYAYFSTPALTGMLAELGLAVTSVHEFALHGGTVVLTASAGATPDAAALPEVARRELETGVLRPAAVEELSGSADRTVATLRAQLQEHRAAGRRVYGYGAASRAVALLRMVEADATLLQGVADASASKQGCRMPGTDVPIVSPAQLVAAGPDVVLVFVSELVDEARAALPQVEAAGGIWVDAGSGV